MQEKMKKILSNVAKGGCCVFALVGGLAATYFLVPKRTEVIDLGGIQEEVVESTYFQEFVTRLTDATKENVVEENAFEGLSADFEDFEISWPNNNVKVDGNLKFSMHGLNNINLSLDVNADYNGKTLDLGLGFVDKTLYLALKDLRVKTSFIENEDVPESSIIYVLDQAIDNFFNADNPDGLQINFDIQKGLDSLLSGIDLNSLMSGGIDFVPSEKVVGDEVNINLAIGIPAKEEDGEDTKISIDILMDKNTLGLKKVDLGTIKIGDVEIKGKLNCQSKDIKILGLDHPEYPVKRGEFIEIVNYSRWMDKIFNLLKTRQIGLDINADLKMHEDNSVTSLGYVNLNADLDAHELFDLSNFDLDGLIKGQDVGSVIKDDPSATPDQNSIVSLLNRLDFNVGLKLGNDTKEGRKHYSDLGLAYYTNNIGHNAGYLSLNEQEENAVMRARIDVETINYLIAQVPELVNSISNQSEAIVKESENEEESFFSFITSSELIKAIQDGQYDGILDLIESLKSTEKTLEIALKLNSLGFGANSKVKLVLDASEDTTSPTKIISIKLDKIMLKNLELNGEVYTRPYNKAPLTHVDAIADKYDPIDFVPGVFDEVSQIVNTKQAALTLSGSVLDESKLGFGFDGWTQLDYGNQNGIGSILFNEYKSNATKVSNNHKVDISIDDFDSNHANNNMLFQYSNPLTGDGTPLRGKFTLKTFDDIIDLVMKLIKEEDRRFMKFFDDIISKLRASVVVSIIESKDYLQLSQSSFVKKVAQDSNGDLDVVISKTLVPLDLVSSDVHIKLNFKKDVKNQKALKGISIVDLEIGEKTINADINLADYAPTRANPVDTSKSFMNFSDIAVLLEFGINSMELNVYHLTGNAHISLGIDVNLDFYIYVNGETTKVYGKMPNLPKISLTGFACTMNSEFVFEPNHDASDNDIGGYFYILRDEDHWLSSLDKQYYYRANSKNFVDNILKYLLSSLLGASDLIADMDLDLGSSKETNPAYENMFTDTGFKYTENNGTHKWDIGIDLGLLTSNNSFHELEVNLSGKEVKGKGYFSQLHAETRILVLGITADINLVDPDPTVENWPDSIEQRYQRIVSFYNTLSTTNKAKADGGPDAGYSCKRGTI